MSHQDLASIWLFLHGRLDIDNILRELIGQYSLKVPILKADHAQLRKASFRHVVTLKAIFDLQRTYLQSPDPSVESKASLLQHDVLFSAIVHLLEVKVESFSPDSGLADNTACCSIFAQTLFSALRALLLRRRVLTPKEHEVLTVQFSKAWSGEQLDDADHFIVNSLCRRVIQELSSSTQNSVYEQPACGRTTLPDFFQGLYPLESGDKSIVEAVEKTSLVSLSSSEWFHNALVLYDVCWSTVAALSQLCMDVRRRRELQRWSLADEAVMMNDLDQILTARFRLQEKIYGEAIPGQHDQNVNWSNEQMKALLSSGLRSTCSQDQCDCLGDNHLAAIQNQRLKYGGQDVLSQVRKYSKMAPYIEEVESALKQLHSTLESRASALLDSSGELKGLAQSLNDYTQSWAPGLAYSMAYGSKGNPVSDDLYIMNCPKLHPVPSKDLYNMLKEEDREDKRLKRDKTLLVGVQSNIKCDQCNWRSDTISARKIEPLSKISSDIQDQLRIQRKNAERRAELHDLMSKGSVSSIHPKRQDEVPSGLRSTPFPTSNTPIDTKRSNQVHEERRPSNVGVGLPHEIERPNMAFNDRHPPFTDISTVAEYGTGPDSKRSKPTLNDRRPSYADLDSSPNMEPRNVASNGRSPSLSKFSSVADLNVGVDASRSDHALEERHPSFAPAYSDIKNAEMAAQVTARQFHSSPLSSHANTQLPQTQQIDRENFPELHHINPENFPEVVESSIQRRPGPVSIGSDDSNSRFVRDTPARKQKKWQSLFTSSRSSAQASSIPLAAFFTCGKSLLLWNERGAGCYDLHNAESIGFRRINASNVRIAAGGADKCAVVSKSGTEHILRVFEGSCDAPVREWKVEGLPYAMSVSRNDHYLALKYSRHVQIFDITSGTHLDHQLPHQNSRSGRGNHLVAFSNDSLSFITSTRYEPEKVITYWSECTVPSSTNRVESSAPFGLVGDDGLSALVYPDSTLQAAFLTSFTEKGYPVLLSLKDPSPVSRLLRDHKGQIGARIHRATLCDTGTDLVLINQRNDIFWITDPFGHEQVARQVASIKRSTSVKRELEMGMPTSDEVHIFWIDKGRGKLVTVGKSGGKSKPRELTVDMELLVA